MTTPTDADAALRALAEEAEKASPGPWRLRPGVSPLGYDTPPSRTLVTGDASTGVAMTHHEVAAFIAACSPDRILELLDGKAAAERERDEWKQAYVNAEGARHDETVAHAADHATLRTSLTRAEARVGDLEEQVAQEFEAHQDCYSYGDCETHPAECPHQIALTRAEEAIQNIRDHEMTQDTEDFIDTYDAQVAPAALPAQPKEGEVR